MVNTEGCIRCGKCCSYVMYDTKGDPYLKKCKHLVRFTTGRTLCRMYHKRNQNQTEHGLMIDSFFIDDVKQKVFCMWRENGQYNYEGCPLNIDGLPSFDDHCRQLRLKIKRKDINIPSEG